MLATATSLIGTDEGAGMNCSQGWAVLALPASASGSHLQIRQLRLASLPQGPAERHRQHRLLLADATGGNPPAEWTLLLWFIDRWDLKEVWDI